MYDRFIDIFSINYDKNILSSIGLGDMHMDVITQLERTFIHIFCTKLIEQIQNGNDLMGSLAKQKITEISDETLDIFIRLITSNNSKDCTPKHTDIENGKILQTKRRVEREILKGKDSKERFTKN